MQPLTHNMMTMDSPEKNPLTLMQFNVENLFLFLDRYGGEDFDKIDEYKWQSFNSATVANKPLEKLKGLAQCIFDIAPDILMLNEVGGKESLQNFNHYFLHNSYDVQLIEGNSDRGIDVGYLVKKELGYKPILLTHKERPIDFHYAHEEPNKRRFYFSRDVLELRLFEPQGHSPALTFLLTHLKSKLDPHGLDPLGKGRREAELKALAKVYNEVQSELGDEAKIVVAGDMNGVASPLNTDSEFVSLYETTDLVESLEISAVSPNERFTQTQIFPGQAPEQFQIDYIFVSKALAPLVKRAYVYRFKDAWGEPLPAPTLLEQRAALPSDHYPVVAEIDL